jgi:hypothetical protein
VTKWHISPYAMSGREFRHVANSAVMFDFDGAVHVVVGHLTRCDAVTGTAAQARQLYRKDRWQQKAW